MSERVVCRAVELLPVMRVLSSIMSDGTSVGLQAIDGTLFVTCTTGVFYQGHVQAEGDNASMSVSYVDLSFMLERDCDVVFQFETATCLVECGDFKMTLSKSYSEVDKLEMEFTETLTDTQALAGAKQILGLKLEKLYNKPAPIEVHKGLCVQKYPNAVVQAKVNGFDESMMLDSRYVKLLNDFHGGHWDTSSPTALTASLDNGSLLRVPCRRCTEDSPVPELLKGMEVACRLHIDKYGDKLRNLLKFYGKQACRVAIYRGGMITTVSNANSNASVELGETQELVQVIGMPLEAWITFVSAFSIGESEILVGGGKICLRNNQLVVLTSTLQ